MAEPDFGEECCASTDIAGCASFGTGKLDFNGFWEFPCQTCLDEWNTRFNEGPARFRRGHEQKRGACRG